jgi:6-phosphogluconolactonase (cycloisomerase 2 family)
MAALAASTCTAESTPSKSDGAGDAGSGDTSARLGSPVFVGSHTTGTIVCLNLDNASGALSVRSRIDTAMFPRSLAWNDSARVLYATGDRVGLIQAFAFNGQREGLSFLGEVSTGAGEGWPVDLALHPTGRWLLVGHYENVAPYSLVLLGADSAGRLTGERFLVPNLCDDQGTFRVAFDPSGQYAFAVCDDDGVYAYRLDSLSGRLIRVPNAAFQYVIAVDVTFSPRSNVAYLSLDTRISVVSYDQNDGILFLPTKQNMVFSVSGEIVSFPRRPPGPWFAPSMVWNHFGDVLYALNTLENAVAIMEVADDGQLTVAKHVQNLRHPVAAKMAPVGPWLLVVNEENGSVAVFKATGTTLEPVGDPVQVVEGASSIEIGRP